MPGATESPLLTFLLANEPSFHKARLGALYSDFRQLQTTNPDGYIANIEAWRKALAHASRAGVLPSSGLLTLTVDEPLLRALESTEWGRPMALRTVVQESVARREMIGLKEFMDAKETVLVSRWNLSVGAVVGWGLRALGVMGQPVPEGKLVVLANLEECGREFARKIGEGRGRVERIYSRRAFEEEFAGLCGDQKLSKADFGVLLRYLERDKELLIFDQEAVKLRAAGEEKMITQEDKEIASLKTLIGDLEAQTLLLTKRIDALTDQAKTAVEKKNRISALAALRSKKLAESTLAIRYATLSQLEEVFVKIEQAVDQVEIVRIMEGSTKVLAGLNKQVGGVERVDDIVYRLREQMDQVSEVGEVIAEPGRDGVDESEVDDELEAMERVEREKREAEEKIEKDEQERKEAAVTRNRLEELGKAERQAAENRIANDIIGEPERPNEDDATVTAFEKDLHKSTENLKRMNLEPAQEA